MAKRTIVQGSTNQTVDIFIPDSSSSTGAGLTGLVYNSAGLTCYFREGATGTATALTLATQTVGGAHSDGGFVEIDATNMPGLYRLDLSDTMVSGTNPWVTVHLKGATNMAPVTLELELTNFDPFDGTRAGLTALPNAAADGAGGLPISDAGGLDLDTLLGYLTGAVATASALATAQADLDIITGADGVNLLSATQASIDAIETDTNSLNDTKIPNTLNTTALGNIGIDWANVENPTTAVDLSATDIQLCDTVTTNTDMRGTNSAATAAALATVDTVVDAIKAKTDNLTFTSGTDLDCNIQKINDVTITGNGQSGTEFGV
jgi:hypothetical protein